MLGKNKPVYIYEAGQPIDADSSAVRRLTRQELATFMRENRQLFSTKDIKNGKVQLSANALELLRQSGLKSVLETPHVMSAQELQAYSQQRAAASSAAKAQTKSLQLATARQNPAPAAAQNSTLQRSFSFPNFANFFANRQVSVPKVATESFRAVGTSALQHVPTPFTNFLATKRQEEADIHPVSGGEQRANLEPLERVFPDLIQTIPAENLVREAGKVVSTVALGALVGFVGISAVKEANNEHTGSAPAQIASFLVGTVESMHDTISSQTKKLEP